MKYLYNNKIINELEVRKLLLEKGIEDIKKNMGEYVNHNVNFDESDIMIAINGSMEQVLDYLADYDIEIAQATMNKFNGAVLLSTEISLRNLQAVKDAIKETVYNLTKTEDIGVRKLAYDIKNNKEAYYIQFWFEDNAENIEELEKYFRANDDVLKFIIIKEE